MITEYKVVFGINARDLEVKVNNCLKEGWRICGSMQVHLLDSNSSKSTSSESTTHFSNLLQPMVRSKEEN